MVRRGTTETEKSGGNWGGFVGKFTRAVIMRAPVGEGRGEKRSDSKILHHN